MSAVPPLLPLLNLTPALDTDAPALAELRVAAMRDSLLRVGRFDPQRARLRLLDRLASEQMPLIGFHLPGGGIGRAERTDGTYRFVES